jgi:hypothetical protein
VELEELESTVVDEKAGAWLGFTVEGVVSDGAAIGGVLPFSWYDGS